MQFLIFLLNLCELLSCLVGLFSLKKLKGTYWAFFPFYLFFIVVSELIGDYLKGHNYILENAHYYNYLEIPIEFLFVFWLFYKAFEGRRYRWLPIFCSVIYIVSWWLDNFYVTEIRAGIASSSYTVASTIVLILLLAYFLKLTFSDAILTFRHNMMFWVSTGMLIYYVGSFPYYGLKTILYYHHHSLFLKYSYLELVLDCIMYLMFTFSFIWGKPNIKSL